MAKLKLNLYTSTQTNIHTYTFKQLNQLVVKNKVIHTKSKQNSTLCESNRK